MKISITKAFLFLGASIMLVKAGHAQSSQSLSSFDRLKIDGNIEVELVITDRYAYSTDKPELVEVKVVNNELTVANKKQINVGKERVKVKVFARTLESIDMDGATKLNSNDIIVSDRFSVDLDGASKATLLVRTKNIKMDLDGSSSLDIKGSAGTASVDADGAAKIRATGLTSESVTVEADGAASVHVNAMKTLNAKADGASNVRFTGEPGSKNISTDGVAKVKRLDDNDK
jgi:hypothetical protein